MLYPTELTMIFDGEDGWLHDGVRYRLACAPGLTVCPNGDLLCTWLSGSGGEPAVDNCSLISRSVDGGKTWSEPEIFVPVDPVLGCGSGFTFEKDGRLFALYGYFPAAEEYTKWYWFQKESRDNGHTWSQGRPIVLWQKEGESASFGGITRLADGSWRCAVQVFRPREYPLTASPMRLALARDEQEAAGMPPRGDQEPDAEKFGRCLHSCGVVSPNEDFTAFTMLGGVSNRPLGLLEPNILELKDGRLVMLMRAEWGGFLWRSDSTDGGKTWCPAYETDIPNPSALICLTRLPDVRIALVHNPTGGVRGQRGPRSLLSFWISEDELQSFSVKLDLVAGGYLSYPSVSVADDGKILVAYDHDRKSVRLLSFYLPD